MTKAHSSKPSSARKPAKPYKTYPLFPHQSGQWAKKVRGKLYYFGTWSDPNAALERWVTEKDHILLHGCKPERSPVPDDQTPSGLTVHSLCNLFLDSVERRVASGERSQRSYDDYLEVSKLVAKFLGKTKRVESLRPSDFAQLRDNLGKNYDNRTKKKRVAIKTLEGRIARTRAIFNYADKNALIETSLRRLWGTEFDKPSRKSLAKEKAAKSRTFEPHHIRALLALPKAKPHYRAMILLGINCAFGPTDLALLERSHIDFEAGTVELPRSKTGKARRCFLWPETIKAIQDSLAKRRQPHNAAFADRVFITSAKGSWESSKNNNPLAKEFAKLRNAAKIPKGLSFYGLRHTFQTVGDESRDFVAVSAIMGHAPTSISDNYRGKISDDRLKAVTDLVRDWLDIDAQPIKKVEVAA